jgi:hypothetical protein
LEVIFEARSEMRLWSFFKRKNSYVGGSSVVEM